MEPLRLTWAQWNEEWWKEFHRLRMLEPNEPLSYIQSLTLNRILDRYGPPPEEEKAGPPWWMSLGATAIGVPMGFLQKFWDYMNGKKTVVGIVITVLATVAGYLPVVLPFVGVSAVTVAKVIGIATTVVGIAHKIYKFLYKEDHA